MSEDQDPPARELLVDTGIERALLGVLLTESSFVEPVFEVTAPNQFGLAAHSLVAQAMKLVLEQGKPVNIPNVATKLRQMGKLQESGGSKFLVELELENPAGTLEDVISWAEQIRDQWQRRALLNEARLLAAKIETNSVEDVFAAVAETAQRAELYRPVAAVAVGCWADEMADPVEPPKPIDWLLRDERTDKGALALGFAALLAAGGGTGKTTALHQLAVCVALGIPWCGLTIANPGAVAICCGESNDDIMRMHLWKAYNSLGLDDEQRREAAHNIYAKPLMGHIVNVLGSSKRGDYERTPFLTQFKTELSRVSDRCKTGFSLVILDPLSRFAGKDTETDNSAATMYVSAVETLCGLPGKPAVINAHHSSKSSTQNGKNDARGVTALVDGFRGVMTMTAFRFESLAGVLLSNTKNNLAPHFEDRWLIQQHEKGMGGTVRIATEDEAAALGEAMQERSSKRNRSPRPSAAKTEKVNLHDAIVCKLRELGGAAKSREWLYRTHLAGYRKTQVWDAFQLLYAQHEITIDASGPSRGNIRLVDGQKQTELGI